MPRHVTIRPARAADAQALFQIVEEFAMSFVPEFEVFEAALHDATTRPDASVLVAEALGRLDGYLLGFARPTFYANGPVGWVEEIAVAGAHRRDGIGRALMEEFEIWAGDRGCRLVGVATRRAAPFYMALGYEDSAAYMRKLL